MHVKMKQISIYLLAALITGMFHNFYESRLTAEIISNKKV